MSPIPQVDLLQGAVKVSELAAALKASLSVCGFVHLVNHGIESELIDEAFSVSKKLFALPAEFKERYALHRDEQQGDLQSYY